MEQVLFQRGQVRTSLGKLEIAVLGTGGEQALGAACSQGSRCTCCFCLSGVTVTALLGV